MVVDFSRPIAQVARELGVNDTTLGFWVKDIPEEAFGGTASAGYAGPGAAPGTGAPHPGAGDGKRVPEKSSRVLREGASVTDKYEFIDAEYAVLPAAAGHAPTIMQMCAWLEVSKSGYYEWRSRPESATALRRELLKIKIKALFEANDETYGYRRIHAALVRGGEQVSDELVRQLMRELGLVPCQPKPRAVAHRTGRCGRADPGPGQPRLHRGRARRENGRRHHLHRNLGGMALSRDGYRLRDPQARRLGDGR